MAVVSANDLGPASVEDKATFLFDVFDVGQRGSLTLDELTILLLSTARATVLMLGRGLQPTDAEMEQYSLRVFHNVGVNLSSRLPRAAYLQAMTVVLNLSSPQIAFTGFGPDELLVALGLIPPPPSEGFPYSPPTGTPSLLAQHLTQPVFTLLMEYQTPKRGLRLTELIQAGVDSPQLAVGVVVGDEECYTTFSSLLDPIISALHGGFGPNARHRVDANTAGVRWGDLPNLVGAAGANAVDRVQVSVRRNVAGYAFPSAMSRVERREVEAVLANAFKKLGKKLQGRYLSLEGEEGEKADKVMRESPLFEDGFFHRSPLEIFDTNPRAISEHADARGVWVCDGHPCAALVNEEDHLQVQWEEEGEEASEVTSYDDHGNVRMAFERLYAIVFDLQTRLEEDGASFTYTPHLGYVTSDPSHLGTALNLEVTARLPYLLRRRGDLHDLSHRLGLRCQETAPAETGMVAGVMHIVHAFRLGHSEIETLHVVLNGVRLLTQLEAALARGDSSQWDLLCATIPRAWVPPNIPPVTPPRLPLSLPLNARKAVRVTADFPTFIPKKHTSIVAQVLTPELWEKLKGRQTAGGFGLKDVLRPALDSPAVRVGVCSCDAECFTTFWDLFEALLPDTQGPVVTAGQRPPSELIVSPLPLCLTHPAIKMSRISVARNVTTFALSPGITRLARKKLERLLVSGLESIGAGIYRPLRDEMGNEADLAYLKAKGLLFNHPPARDSFLRASGSARDWPDGRGFFLQDHGGYSTAVWLNEEDHLRFLGWTEAEDLGVVSSKVFELVQKLEAFLTSKGLGYVRDERLGYLMSSPVNLGTGVRVTVGCDMGPGFRFTAKVKAKIKSELSLELAKDSVQGLILVSNTSTMMEPTEAAVLRWMKVQVLTFLEQDYVKQMGSPSSAMSPRVSKVVGPPMSPGRQGVRGSIFNPEVTSPKARASIAPKQRSRKSMFHPDSPNPRLSHASPAPTPKRPLKNAAQSPTRASTVQPRASPRPSKVAYKAAASSSRGSIDGVRASSTAPNSEDQGGGTTAAATELAASYASNATSTNRMSLTAGEGETAPQANEAPRMSVEMPSSQALGTTPSNPTDHQNSITTTSPSGRPSDGGHESGPEPHGGWGESKGEGVTEGRQEEVDDLMLGKTGQNAEMACTVTEALIGGCLLVDDVMSEAQEGPQGGMDSMAVRVEAEEGEGTTLQLVESMVAACTVVEAAVSASLIVDDAMSVATDGQTGISRKSSSDVSAPPAGS